MNYAKTLQTNDVLCAYCEENYLTDSTELMCESCENKRATEPDWDTIGKDMRMEQEAHADA